MDIVIFDIIMLMGVAISLIAIVTFFVTKYYEGLIAPFIMLLICSAAFIMAHIGPIPVEGTEVRHKKIEDYIGDIIIVNDESRQIIDYKPLKNSFILDNGVTIDINYAKTLTNDEYIEVQKTKNGWIWYEKDLKK